MDDEVFTPPSPSVFEDMDFDFMDELLDVECWSPTANGSDFLQPGPSTSQSLDETTSSLTSVPHQSTNSYQQEKEIWSLLLNNPSKYISKEEPIEDTQFQDQKSKILESKTPNQTLSFCWESDELNKILWIEPRAYSSVKDRLMSAILQLKELNKNRDVLIQTWVPVKKGLESFLTTVEQPHFFQPSSKRLLHYRDVSEKYEFLADEDTKQALGLPGRVFLGKVPEWTPDVRFFRQEEYPRVEFAHHYDVRGSIALPVFENSNDECLGVVEIIMTTEKFNYRPEVESICKALETVHLRSSETLSSSKAQAVKNSYEVVIPEILNVLRTVSEKHKLPLAQTWASCSQQGEVGCGLSDKSTPCVSIIQSAFYARDQRVLEFHKACSEHHLTKARGGIVGKALESDQPCFASDITEFSKTDYPLAHHAKMFGLRGALAVRLSSIYQEMNDFVLEFYLPVDFQETGLGFHDKISQSISMVLQQTCPSLKLITVKKNNLIAEKSQQGTSSWFSLHMNPQKRSKEVVSLNFGEKDPSKALKNSEQDSKSDGISGVSFGGRSPLGSRKVGKQRSNVQKTLSLQVLRQYFAGSLKDAAKNIGVCPTTLKRICRQHGIARWPSRKIKKVGHSLKKLQLVIDSVEGVEGSIQLSSFYTNFPELNSPDTQVRGNQVPTTSNSTSTSSSHTSTSGHCYPIELNKYSTIGKDTSATEVLAGSLKRARSEAELQTSSKNELSRILEGSQSNNKAQDTHPPFESLPTSTTAKIWPTRDKVIWKAKATFGEEKIRFTILPNMGFQDLQQEMARRFSIAEWSKIGIKYLDDDREWILLTCDADLEECKDTHRSSGSHIVKLSLSHFTNSIKIGGFPRLHIA